MHRFLSTRVLADKIDVVTRKRYIIDRIESAKAKEFVAELQKECHTNLDFAFSKDGFSTILLNTNNENELFKSSLCRSIQVDKISKSLSYFFKTNFMVKSLNILFLKDINMEFIHKRFKNDSFHIRLKHLGDATNFIQQVMNGNLWFDENSLLYPMFAHRRYCDYQTNCLVAYGITPKEGFFKHNDSKFCVFSTNTHNFIYTKDFNEYYGLMKCNHGVKVFFEPYYNQENLSNTLGIEINKKDVSHKMLGFINNAVPIDILNRKYSWLNNIDKGSVTMNRKRLYSNKLYLKKNIASTKDLLLPENAKYGYSMLSDRPVIYFDSVIAMENFHNYLLNNNSLSYINNHFTYIPYWMHENGKFMEVVEPWFIRNVIRILVYRKDLIGIKKIMEKVTNINLLYIDYSVDECGVLYYECSSEEEALKIVFGSFSTYMCDIEILSHMSARNVPYANMFTLHGLQSNTTGTDVINWLKDVNIHLILKSSNSFVIFVKSPKDIHTLMNYQLKMFGDCRVLIKQYESNFANYDSLKLQIIDSKRYSLYEKNHIHNSFKLPEIKIGSVTGISIGRISRDYSCDFFYSSGKQVLGYPVILDYYIEKTEGDVIKKN